VKKRVGMRLAAGCLLLAALQPGVTASAAAPQARTPTSDEELDEVIVSGNRVEPVRSMRTILEWLVRLVGQYRYEGFVELKPGPGVPQDRLPVRGVGDCVRFGIAPGVQCSVAIRWPEVKGPAGEEVVGGVSTLNPAMILYGLDPDQRGIHFLQVDQRGIADGGVGFLIGDVLTTKAPCEGIPGDCQRTTKIDAAPDGKLIQMQVEIHQDGERVAHFHFEMQRVAQQDREPRR
jgi:hypothetical protein